MNWQNKLDQWTNGKTLSYPNNISKRFFYETIVCSNPNTDVFEERFIESDELENIGNQDYSSFVDQFNKSSNQYVTSFYNLSGDTKLIVPIPRPNRDYCTVKDFIDNADQIQQEEFWKVASNEIKLFLQSNPRVFVSTHGLGVSYFHLRLCTFPKYYHAKEFI